MSNIYEIATKSQQLPCQFKVRLHQRQYNANQFLKL